MLLSDIDPYLNALDFSSCSFSDPLAHVNGSVCASGLGTTASSKALSDARRAQLLLIVKGHDSLPYNVSESRSLDVFYLAQPKSEETLTASLHADEPLEKNSRKRRSSRDKSSDDFGTPNDLPVKKAVNFSSVSRIAAYPRLRSRLETLQQELNDEGILSILRKLLYLEQYAAGEQPDISSGRVEDDSRSVPFRDRLNGTTLLPFEIESLILESLLEN